jgi:hypothetical protein
MSISTYIKIVLDEAESQGASWSMVAGRDLVAQLLFGANYNAVLAAESAGNLREPNIDNARIQEARNRYGARVDILANLLLESQNTLWLYAVERPTMTATEAYTKGYIPAPPSLDLAAISSVQAELKARTTQNKRGTPGLELEWITFNPWNLYPGRHLRFVRANGTWYALKNEFYKNGEAHLTVEFNNSVFHYNDGTGDDDIHLFLCWVYEAGNWKLIPLEHTMADPDQLDLNFVELNDY